ncbi:hypothetical protein [Peribacillus frigoritolerans]|uniref:hypothetical protein n=1 Tax=Peribacillus frigoritolerans TaxID=450367 RepID=UPI003015FF0C
METEKDKKGYIRVGHLVYIIIIAVIVLAFFLVFALGDSKTASTTIGTASTVSSLILSVIAIVMTLIDVAGQRQSMVDLKETADQLQKSNESASELTENLITQIANFQDVREQMVKSVVEAVGETMKEVDEGQKELLEKIKDMMENGKYEEVKEVIENEKANKTVTHFEKIFSSSESAKDYFDNYRDSLEERGLAGLAGSTTRNSRNALNNLKRLEKDLELYLERK